MISKIILSTEPTKANIYPALRAEPGEALAPSWLQCGVNTGHIPSPISLGRICILIYSNSTSPFSVMTTFITIFSSSSSCSLTQTHVHTHTQSGFTLPSYLKAFSLLRFFAKALGCCRCHKGLSVPDRARGLHPH